MLLFLEDLLRKFLEFSTLNIFPLKSKYYSFFSFHIHPAESSSRRFTSLMNENQMMTSELGELAINLQPQYYCSSKIEVFRFRHSKIATLLTFFMYEFLISRSRFTITSQFCFNVFSSIYPYDSLITFAVLCDKIFHIKSQRVVFYIICYQINFGIEVIRLKFVF